MVDPCSDGTRARLGGVLAPLSAICAAILAWAGVVGVAHAERDAERLFDRLPKGTQTRPAAPLIRTPALLWYADYREVLVGHAEGPEGFLSRALDLHATLASTRCVGKEETRLVPPQAHPRNRCDGVRGDITLRCSDGRAIRLESRREEHCGAALGRGQDSEGNAVDALLGGSPERVRAVLEGALVEAVGKAELPAAGAAPGAPGRRGVSTGSAFFVTGSGDLLTNYHVVAGAKRVIAHLADGEALEAERVADDPESDLALLRISAIGDPLPLRRDATLREGETVFTVGYPALPHRWDAVLGRGEAQARFGAVYDATVSANAPGVALDLAVRPGHSGGPLLNAQGEVVGVVTSIRESHLSVGGDRRTGAPRSYAVSADRAEPLLRRALGADRVVWRVGDSAPLRSDNAGSGPHAQDRAAPRPGAATRRSRDLDARAEAAEASVVWLVAQ